MGPKARGIGDCVLPRAESKQGNAGGSPGASRLHAASCNALLQLVCTLLWLSCRGGQAFICLQSLASPGLHSALFLSLCLFFFLPSSPLLPRRRQESEQTCLPKDALCLPGRRRPIPAVHFLPVPRAPGMLSHTCTDPAPTPPTSYYIPEIKYLMSFVRG